MKAIALIKESHELTRQEIDELNQLSRLVNANNALDHIEVNHLQKNQPTLDLYKVAGRIRAAQGYKLFHKLTPFSKKPLPIVYVSFSYKDPSAGTAVKNYAKQSNLKMIAHFLGKFWYLRHFVLLFMSHNPKLIFRTGRAFQQVYYGFGDPAPPAVLQFYREAATDYLYLDGSSLTDDLVVVYQLGLHTDVTAHWDKLYATNDPAISQSFIDRGIIYQEGTRYFLTEKIQGFVGYYTPWGLVQNYVRNGKI